MKIVNLTQHVATPAQEEAGVVSMEFDRDWLNFDEAPHWSLLKEIAEDLANAACYSGAKAAMIGGAPFLMGPLEAALLEVGVEPVYAFSVRESTEQEQPDGSVRKVNVFKHKGFVRPYERRFSTWG